MRKKRGRELTELMKYKKKIKFQIFLIGILLIVAAGCNDRHVKVLPEDKMVSLLVDMELTEAYVNSQPLSSKERLEMGQRVLAAHKVTKEELDTTLAWYGRNVDDYSKLFEKVDKEIARQRKIYTEVPGSQLLVADNLWPYSTHLLISPMSGDRAFTFSLPSSTIEKGSRLEFSMFLPNSANLKSTFGVEYTDGNGEAIVSTATTKKGVKLEIQTDSARQVARVFGIFHLKDGAKSLPLYIDSILLKKEPIDSTEYRNKRRSQKKFGVLQPKQPVVTQEEDSIKIDTDREDLINKKDSIKKENPQDVKEDNIQSIQALPTERQPKERLKNKRNLSNDRPPALPRKKP
ncbi:MAG: DUF4296 domain-containing protein [Muribaculaceae bacterium]|nr:DUF4296 domain-containing protein [Muribaculaceae bacterium]